MSHAIRVRETATRAATALEQALPSLASLTFRMIYGPLGEYLARARRIPGFLSRKEGMTLARLSYALPDDAIIVEIGSFLGRSAVIFAGAREMRGSGVVHCVDRFDASGDDFSTQVYRVIAGRHRLTLREEFDAYVSRAAVQSWVRVHQGDAASIAGAWTAPIDLLFLDGDQSPEGARLAYDAWAPFLKVGGILALHNANDREYDPTHNGHWLLATHVVRPPNYEPMAVVDTAVIARKLKTDG